MTQEGYKDYKKEALKQANMHRKEIRQNIENCLDYIEQTASSNGLTSKSIELAKNMQMFVNSHTYRVSRGDVYE